MGGVIVEIEDILGSQDRISDKDQPGGGRSERAEIRYGFFSARPALVVTGEQRDGLVHDTVAVRQHLRGLGDCSGGIGSGLDEFSAPHDLVIHEAAGFTGIRFQAAQNQYLRTIRCGHGVLCRRNRNGEYQNGTVESNCFHVVAGGHSGLKVSWQITGIRQDAHAKAHPLLTEVDKPERERGHYINPELYGAPQENSVAWARHPELMKRLKQRRQTLAVQPKP
jgi:hypothetical protein